MRGLDPTDKGNRLANYFVALRKEVLAVSRACGKVHPSEFTIHDCEIIDERFRSQTIGEVFDLVDGDDWGLPSEQQRAAIKEVMAA